MTVMDLAAKGANNNQKIGGITLSQLEEGARALAPGDVGKALLALLQNVNGDLQVAQKNIENWFDDAMERASGSYKRKTQIVTVIVAAVLTICTNADTLRIGGVALEESLASLHAGGAGERPHRNREGSLRSGDPRRIPGK
jgi:hypothetical protein